MPMRLSRWLRIIHSRTCCGICSTAIFRWCSRHSRGWQRYTRASSRNYCRCLEYSVLSRSKNWTSIVCIMLSASFLANYPRQFIRGLLFSLSTICIGQTGRALSCWIFLCEARETAWRSLARIVSKRRRSLPFQITSGCGHENVFILRSRSAP